MKSTQKTKGQDALVRSETLHQATVHTHQRKKEYVTTTVEREIFMYVYEYMSYIHIHTHIQYNN